MPLSLKPQRPLWKPGIHKVSVKLAGFSFSHYLELVKVAAACENKPRYQTANSNWSHTSTEGAGLRLEAYPALSETKVFWTPSGLWTIPTASTAFLQTLSKKPWVYVLANEVLNYFLFSARGYFACLEVCVSCVYTGPRRLEVGVGLPGIGDSCKQPRGCWVLWKSSESS